MPLNFNVDPYYDDFDASKNYHRILFKPGFAVQARELTQAQTILQDQITKFADNIFKQNSPVTGGQVTSNFNCHYIKLQETYNGAAVDSTQFEGKLIQDQYGLIVARVIAVVQSTGTGGLGDPPTLIVSYKSGAHFTDNQVIYDSLSNLTAQAVVTDAVGNSSVVSIAQGVFYISSNYKNSEGLIVSNGTFVQVNPQTVVLSKYSNTPSNRVGLNITETIQDYVGDTALLDPAIGASNYQAPGADRYMITLTLESRPLTFGDDDGFIELLRVENGNSFKMVDGSVYNVIDDYFAKRDYETNGDYVVNDFKLTPKTNTDSSKYTLSVGKGLAYVHGYRVENPAPIDLVSDRARTTDTQSNNPVFMDFGSYFSVNTVRGAGGSFFDVTTSQQIDLHCVPTANIANSTAAAYNSTVVASAYIRSLVYDHNTTNANTASYVYKAYVNDIQNNVVTGTALAGGTNTITLPSTFSATNDAYVGVNISITSGKNAGDFKTITAYNGTTKVATVNANWTTTPDTTSVFALNFDIKDIESIASVNKSSYPATYYATAAIDDESKVNGVPTGDTVLSNPTVPEMLFRIGSSYVSGLTDTSFTTIQTFRNIAFTTSGGSVTTQLNYGGDYAGIIKHFGTPSTTLSADLVKQNYTIVVTNKGSNSSINVGDVLNWTTASRTITLDSLGSIATLSASDLTSFSATVVVKAFVVNADNTGLILKGKNLITANTTAVNISGTTVNTYTNVDDTSLTSTGQVYIQKAGLVSPGNKQSLYLSDVKSIAKIIDTKSASVTPTAAMLTDPTYDVSTNYTFDNGQRDNFYDHASITLRPGATQPVGNLLVLLNYYQHTGGDGYFSIQSYISSTKPETYQQIPNYRSTQGTTYALRDSLDFRPARKNAQSSFVFRYSNESDTTKYGTFLPVDLTTFVGDYSYYLGRKDKLVLTKDKSFQIVQGSPSLQPILPTEPEGSLVIANLNHNPYTGFIPTETPAGFLSDLSIDKIQHKRYTMQDIAGLENRINQVEYYTALNSLEQSATALQIPDTYGLNRFKNGILVDDFSDYKTADTVNNDYKATINRRTRQMTASQNVDNFPLTSLAQAYNMGSLSTSAAAGLGFAVGRDGLTNYFTLPYTTSLAISQKLASRVVNLNPFSVPTSQGLTSLSPNVDTWVDKNYSPALLITDPNLQVFSASNDINVLSVGDWQTVSGTTSSVTSATSSSARGANVEGHNINWSPFGFVGFTPTITTTTSTTVSTTTLLQQQNSILGPYSSIGNTYALNNGYITDISILPWIRSQQIVVRSRGMLINTTVHAYFDGTNVDKYVRNTNTIELNSVSGSFAENDIVGYYTSGVFYPTARVVGVYAYPGTTNVRLYVAADQSATTYSATGTLQNAYFDGAGVYQSSTATAGVTSHTHNGSRVVATTGTTIQLSSLASSVNSFYNGKTIYINAGDGVGQSATISSYVGSTRTATLSTSISCSIGDIYSIGPFTTNENGSFYGIFNLPTNTFHTGERVFRVDNSVNDNLNTSTTFAEGTFYASGLSTQSQQIDFGASPAGAKGTFSQTSNRSQVSSATTTSTTSAITAYSPWDPVAQTFIIDNKNYPNGMYLKSARFFFASKPSVDRSPVTLSIVGTLNGYPNGDTLDHSVVEMTPDKIVVSANPHYLDSASYTTFNFSVPIYIQPNVLYSFILKSSSNEYTLWTASNGDTAIPSSVKNVPTDPTPATISKITTAPYVGGLFISQNSQTWTADQNQSLMFTIDRCLFDITNNPSVQFVVPNKLPQRTLVDQSVDYYQNANSVSSTIDSVSYSDILVDAFNVTTTDFIPTTTGINYSFNSTLTTGSSAGLVNITPGKYGTSMYDNIYLSDGKGERILLANSSTSFSVYTQLNSQDSAVSPIVSDAGLSVYSIKWNINNCELSNNLITITDGGRGYLANANGTITGANISVSAPTGAGGSQAYVAANVVNGNVTSVYVTTPGSGYVETPTITILGSNTSPSVITVTGETSKSGGPALSKYVTKKVVLDSGFDSGDLNVYLTAYRPVNTDILVYYKILNRNDTQSFDDGNWQLMNMVRSGSSVYSPTRNDVYEYQFAPGTGGVDQGYVTYTSTNGQTYTSFSQFAIKVVLVSSDHTYVPFLNDLRCIALPANVNTTF